MYYNFIANVIYHDVQDIIIPFPYPSTIAYKVLMKIQKIVNLKYDFAFVDGSHEEMEVYMDLLYYYSLLDDKGILCGDDYSWSAIKNDLHKFCKTNNKNFTLMSNNVHWYIQK